MYKFMKFAHIIGLCMFMGGISVHAIVGFVPGGREVASVIVVGRQVISIATWALMVPGLTLLAVSGIFMVLRTPGRLSQRTWLMAHIGIATLAIINTAAILIPMDSNISQAALNLLVDSHTMPIYQAIKQKESVAGRINLLLSLVAIIIATIRPSVRRTKITPD